MNTNAGHGWVHPRPDGIVAKCGGPSICSECAREKAQVDAEISGNGWLRVERGGRLVYVDPATVCIKPELSIETSSTQPTALMLPVAWSVGHPITVHNTGTADLNIYANGSITLKPGETWTSPKEIR